MEMYLVVNFDASSGFSVPTLVVASMLKVKQILDVPFSYCLLKLSFCI